MNFLTEFEIASDVENENKLRRSGAGVARQISRLSDRRQSFFFQAEDGIRDDLVTGVQTCALPILARSAPVTGQCCPHPRPRAAHNPDVKGIRVNAEKRRLDEDRLGQRAWRHWGPYLDRKSVV